MGRADEIMRSFFAAHPEVMGGKVSMEELNHLLAEHQKKLNNEGLDDFDGLSPEQMSGLLYFPFKRGSMIQFREDIDEHVDKAPFFKLSEILLNEIKKAGKVKLTQKGNLPMSVCKLLVNQNLIYWRYLQFVKRITEDDIPYLFPLKQYIVDEGFAKKRNNVLTLTKNGEKLLEGPKSDRFIKAFKYMASRFHWGNFYHVDDGGMSGQLGWAYSLALLKKYGNEGRTSHFYSSKLLRAFEQELLNEYQKHGGTGRYHDAYETRFFETFAHWFGLVDIERTKDPNFRFSEKLTIAKTDLFDRLIKVEDCNAR